MSSLISLCGLHMLIWDDTLRTCIMPSFLKTPHICISIFFVWSMQHIKILLAKRSISAWFLRHKTQACGISYTSIGRFVFVKQFYVFMLLHWVQLISYDKECTEIILSGIFIHIVFVIDYITHFKHKQNMMNCRYIKWNSNQSSRF